MDQTKKAVIFAPFWRQAGHVGNYRIDRFIRWLVANGFYVVLVRAGPATGVRMESWGLELTVRDPLGLHREPTNDDKPIKIRKPKRMRRLLAYWLFNPDPGVLWARVAGRHPTVLEQAEGASFVLSSNPPESAHIGAATLAKKLKIKLIVDMRDGWLDEPLKPLLRISRLQRWRESKLESAILHQADKIFVTSPVWKSLLKDRLPFTQNKTVVLTNAYPPEGLFKPKQTRKRSVDEPLRLVHAGRFTGSMLTRKVSLLLEPLLYGLEGSSSNNGVITLLGELEQDDLVEIDAWRTRFEARGWSIEVKAAIPREEMMDLLDQADGLLLLAEKQAAIPVKLYEYLVAGKPVFTSTPKGGAVWAIGESLPQLFLIDYALPDKGVARSFLAACGGADNHYDIPLQFSEEALLQIFMQEIMI